MAIINETPAAVTTDSNSSTQTDNGLSGSTTLPVVVEENVPGMGLPQRKQSSEENREQSTSFPWSPRPTSPPSLTIEEINSELLDPAKKAEKIKQVSALLRMLISTGGYQLDPEEHQQLQKLLDTICSEREALKFKDAIGRKFAFPWKLVKTWKARFLF